MSIEKENCNLIWRLYRDYLSAKDLSDEFSELEWRGGAEVFPAGANADECWNKVLELARTGKAGIVDLDTSLFHTMVEMKIPEHKVIEFLGVLPVSIREKVLSWHEIERDFEDMKDHLLVSLSFGERDQLLDYVLGVGLDPNIVCNKDGVAPLSIAASHAPTDESVKILLSHGADPNIKDVMGRTPLMNMCTSNRVNADVFWLLLESGARFDCRDNENLSTQELASKYRNVQMLSLLAEFQAHHLSGQTARVSKTGSRLRI